MADFEDYNDGETEGTNVNIVDAVDPSKRTRVITDEDGIDRLQTNSKIDSSEIVPTITNQFRVRLNNANTTLPGGTPGTYVTLFERTGEGLFFGFQLHFSNDDIDVRLEIDSGEVFELSLGDIRDFDFNDTSTTRVQSGAFLTTIGNAFDFSSKFAIPYTTNIKVQARANTGGNKTNNRWIVFLTED